MDRSQYLHGAWVFAALRDQGIFLEGVKIGQAVWLVAAGVAI